MKELTADINLDHEVAAVASFISLKWTAISNVQQLVLDIRREAERYGRSLFDEHPLLTRAHEMLETRKGLLAEIPGSDFDVGIESYDAICILLDSVKSTAKDISDAGQGLLGAWDLGSRSKKLQTALVDRYPDLAEARPRGWSEFENSPEEFARAKEYDPQPDRDAFHGSCVQSTLSPELPVRLAVQDVFLYEKCQGRKASVQLVAAILAHFLGITRFMNTERLVTALPRALPELQVPYLLFERNVSTDNPFLKVAFEVAQPCRTRKEFEQAVKAKAAYEAMSAEQKARRHARSEKWSVLFIESLKANAEEDMKALAAERFRYSVLLSAALDD